NSVGEEVSGENREMDLDAALGRRAGCAGLAAGEHQHCARHGARPERRRYCQRSRGPDQCRPNVVSRTATNGVGFYIFPGVLPGRYRLTVEAPGMERYEATLTVQVQLDATIDPVLKVGQTTTVVEVNDVTPVVTTDAPTLGHVLDRQRIEQLPINGRNVFTLLATAPGMEGDRAYGLREGSQEVTLDGSALSERVYGAFVRKPPGLDTIQEFKVENNSSSAKFTRPTTIVLSTRSGTNDLHGSLFETHRNNGVGKARRREDNYDKPPQLIRNEFGGSAGGPVFLPKI